MSQEVPAGYVTMDAKSIRDAATKAINTTLAKEKVWLEELTPKLVAWRQTPGFWSHQLWLIGTPKDPKKLTKWYLAQYSWDRPDIDGLGERPSYPWMLDDWLRRVKHLADDATVFINVDDAAVLKSWLA